MRLTHQLEKDVGYKVFQFINTMKIMKLLGYKTLQTQQFLEEKDELGHMSLVYNMLVKNFCIEVHQLDGL